MTSNVEIDDLSSGITCFLFHVPHAYWKKSSHGSLLRSIPESRDDAVVETKIVR